MCFRGEEEEACCGARAMNGAESRTLRGIKKFGLGGGMP